MERPPAEVRRKRYLAHLCTDCGEKPHSAGRPRCDECHVIWSRDGAPEPMLERRPRGRGRRY